MATADRMLMSCPRCHSWPMAAKSARGRPETEMLFKCQRCGAQERLGSLLKRADESSHGRDRTEQQPGRTQMGLPR
jgi:RNase P subunit RPR2